MRQPNILIILADGMQAETVEPGHPCFTPNLERLANRGVWFRNAHTVCPTCSPARASFMTGLLPHNHGVLEVEHGRDDDQCVLRTEHPHFAQRLCGAGYRTGYFGKWHVERTHQLNQFGWQESIVKGSEHVKGIGKGDQGPASFVLDDSLCGYLDGPPGYKRVLHWGVTDTPLRRRYPGLTVLDAQRFLSRVAGSVQPWCCCVSFSEPNEALVVGREAWDRYDPDSLDLPGNFFDDLSDRPNIYQRQQSIGRSLSEAHWRAARACYFGRISEIDQLVGDLLKTVETAGQLEETVVVFLADHGRYVGAHGFDAHNFGGFEEIYRIPLIFAGPAIAAASCVAQVTIADVGVTTCDLSGAEPLSVSDARSLKPLLDQPSAISPEFQAAYAEYHGTRFPLMQRILWNGPWKFIFNGFDFDELYNLEQDPCEMRNLASDPSQQDRVVTMMKEIWTKVRNTGDRAILESHYFSMRLACVGPDA